MKHVTQIVRELRQGVTIPILCKTEDGIEYCCKGVHAGFASLCKEWMCANLARALDLPIPDFEILDVPLKLFENWHKAKGDDAPTFVINSCHFVFGSRMVGNVKDVLSSKELTDKKVDARIMSRILMFDRVIHNCDRNDGNSNLLMTSGRLPAVYIIDHNSAFDETFDRAEFMRSHILREFHAGVKQEGRDEFLSDVKGLLSEGIIGDFKSRMPIAWLDGLMDYDVAFFEKIEESITREVE